MFPKPDPWYLSATVENGIALPQVKNITVVGLYSTVHFFSYEI